MVDEGTDVEKEAFEKIDKEKLRRAFQFLEPQQKWLIEQIFIVGKSKTQIAKELGIVKSAISNRLQRIYGQLKKFLI